MDGGNALCKELGIHQDRNSFWPRNLDFGPALRAIHKTGDETWSKSIMQLLCRTREIGKWAPHIIHSRYERVITFGCGPTRYHITFTFRFSKKATCEEIFARDKRGFLFIYSFNTKA